MASNKKKQEKQDDKLIQTLRSQTQLPGNKQCFDCQQRGPTYVNTTIGTFVCTKCSGMLRGLTPPHRVKSISMATFTPEEVDFIKNRGNDYCRKIWLALYDENPEQSTRNEQNIQDFMIAKYEKRRYYMDPKSSIKNGPATELQKLTKGAVSPLAEVEAWPRPDSSSLWQKKRNSQNSCVVSLLSTEQTENFLTTPHPSVKPQPISHIQPPTMSMTAMTNMFTPDRPDTFNFPPVVNDVFGSQPGPQPFFANFDNNPAFDMPPAAPLSTSTSFPSALRPPSEDKYAALKDLDSMMKMQHETESPAKPNGNEWAQTTAGHQAGRNSGNPFTELLAAAPPAPATFNPFRTSVTSPFSIPSSHSMSFPVSWNNTNDLTVGSSKSGNPFL